MARMKTFFKYFLIFVGIYVVSQLLIDAYIKTSYYKIKSYDIEDDAITVTIMSARASKDNGYIEGKISNSTNEKIPSKYMKVELYSENNINLGEEYVKVDEMDKNSIKDFKVSFSCDNVKHFKITFLTPEEKAQEDAKQDKSLFPSFGGNEEVNKIITNVEPNGNLL